MAYTPSPWIPLCLLVCHFTGISPQTSSSLPKGGPYIMDPPHNITAVEGERITFECEAEAYPNNITYNWFKDGIDVKTLAGSEVGRIRIIGGGNLLISSVVKADMAWYMCRPSNGIGEDEASAFLNVTYLPKVLPMPSQLTWAKGFRGKIDCPVDANPLVTETLWTKDAASLVPTKRNRILSNGTLIIINVTMADAGSYSCTPISLSGRGKTSPHVQVLVRDPPYFTVRPLELYQKRPGEDVILPCAATGTPQPELTWRKVGGTIMTNSRVRIIGTNLSFSKLKKEDHGTYECVANNSVATIIAVTELRIMNTTPHAPHNITVVTSIFSARITWEPAYDGGSPQTYILWFRMLEPEDNNWETMVVPQGSTSFTLYSLIADQMYEFMVLSRNHFGDGMFSERIHAKTLGYVGDLVTGLPTDAYGSTYIPDIVVPIGPRPNPPRNVSASLHDMGVYVSWLPPYNTSVPIFYYKIHYRSGELWTEYEEKIMTSQGTSAIVKNLSPGTTYEIRVLSCSVLAFSYSSNIVTITTKSEPLKLPDALIGGIIGGLLFLLVAILLAVIAVIHSKKKEQKTQTNNRYSDVNYSKPEETDGKHQTPPKWDRWQHSGGGNTVTGIDNRQGVFVLPHTSELDTSRDIHRSILKDSRLHDRDHLMYNPDPGYSVASRRENSPYDSNSYIDKSLSRYPDRRYDRPWDRSDQNILGFPTEADSHYSSAVPPGGRPEYYPTNFAHSDPQSGFPFQGSDSRKGPSLSPVNRGYDGPYHSFQSEEEDDVFTPQLRNVPSTRPGFPRHSSMKPTHQTYLTDDEQVPPFGLSDISSVLPSSFADPSYDQHYLRRYPSRDNYSHRDPSIPEGCATHDHRASPRYSGIDPRKQRPHSQEGMQSIPGDWSGYPYNIPDESRDSSLGRDRQVAWMPPKPQSVDENNSTDSSTSRPIGYTRDHLQGAVDRVRQGPRSRQDDSTADDGGFLDVSSALPVRSPYGGSSQDIPPIDRDGPTTDDHRRNAPYYTSDVAPYKTPHDDRGSAGSSGRGSHPVRDARGRQDESVPETASHSSGIGSRNTSQSNGSFPHRLGKNSMSFSSLLTPQDQDLSQDSSPFLDGSSNHRRDTSGDENYEFDSLNAIESDILDALRNYSQLSGGPGSAGPDVYSDLYPQPRRQSRYADSEQRFNRLREEFKQYRRRQSSRDRESPRPLYPMDSEML